MWATVKSQTHYCDSLCSRKHLNEINRAVLRPFQEKDELTLLRVPFSATLKHCAVNMHYGNRGAPTNVMGFYF